VLLALASAAAAQETRRYESEDKRFSLDLPADWKVIPGSGGGVLTLDAGVPGREGRIWLTLYLVDGPTLNAVSQARYEMKVLAADRKARSSRFVEDPVPHFVLEYGEDGSRKALYTFKRQLCRGLHVLFEAPAATFEAVYPALVAVGASARGETERWPPVPEGDMRSV
jgi:hypothetical protein